MPTRRNAIDFLSFRFKVICSLPLLILYKNSLRQMFTFETRDEKELHNVKQKLNLLTMRTEFRYYGVSTNKLQNSYVSSGRH